MINDIESLVDLLNTMGFEVFGPVYQNGKTEYRKLTAKVAPAEGTPPRNSAKEYVLPRTEKLFSWERNGKDYKIIEVPAPKEQVLLGLRPCDAAGFEIVDKVMSWEPADDHWFARRNKTTIISFTCDGGDESCFCTAVGLGPASKRGSDILITKLSKGYHLEILTDRGEALASKVDKLFVGNGNEQEAETIKTKAHEKVESRLSIDPAKIQQWLSTHFEHEIWSKMALKCHGCGACAMVCPTCHCFDIIDEPESPVKGSRRRNWDVCQASVFTLHASGHNPRPDQNSRYRQRITHKFQIYPERFNEILCTGCGRCIRACVAGMDLIEILGELNELASGGEQ